MTVPFLDFAAAQSELGGLLEQASARVLRSNRYILGPELERFEREFADYCGVRHCVGVGNGLEALALVLEAKGIGQGDEVIVPSHTFIATWLAVSRVGATIVPVEPDEATYNLDPQRLRESLTPRTRAVIPVHLYGQPADMDGIRSAVEDRNIFILEDAAQAHGAKFRGARVGSLGHAGSFSFYPAKNLGAYGDGGAVTTNDDMLADAIRRRRNYGSSEKYVHEVIAGNSRLDELQAALLRVKLSVLDKWNEGRRDAAARYIRLLSNTSSHLVLPSVSAWCEPVWHLFVIRSTQKQELQRRLAAAEIGYGIHYPIPPHEQRAFQGLGLQGAFPIASRLATQVLSLPIGPHLSRSEQTRVCEVLDSSSS